MKQENVTNNRKKKIETDTEITHLLELVVRTLEFTEFWSLFSLPTTALCLHSISPGHHSRLRVERQGKCATHSLLFPFPQRPQALSIVHEHFLHFIRFAEWKRKFNSHYLVNSTNVIISIVWIASKCEQRFQIFISYLGILFCEMFDS